MSFTRRKFLVSGVAAAAGGALVSRGAGAKSAQVPSQLIIVLTRGGWDPTFVFEPRLGDDFVEGPEVDEDPDNSEDIEALRTFGEVTLAVNDFKRPAVTTFFEKWMPRSAIVNGIWTGAIAHAPSMIRMLTGTISTANPDFGAIIGHKMGADLPLGYIDLAGSAFPGKLAASVGQVGQRSQILTLLDNSYNYTAPTGAGVTYPQYAPTPGDQEAVQAWLLGRADRLRAVRGDVRHNDQLFDDLAESLERAKRFRDRSTSLLSQLTLGRTPSATESQRLAVDLLEANLCSAVITDTRLDWDTHTNNVDQHGFYEETFAGLDILIQDLKDRAMLDRTMVVVLSEMSRTPKRNADLGKDHWSHSTALLIGGGVQGGRVYGGYDDILESRRVDLQTGEVDEGGVLLRYENFVAGILQAFDIDSRAWLPHSDPFTGFHG